MEPSTYPYSTEFKTTDSAQSLSILSWNLIFPPFAEDFPEDYPNRAPEDLAWAHRLPKIKDKLAHSNADIICLQEIDKHNFAKDIGDEFKQRHGYEFHVNKAKKSRVDFTTAVLFKSTKFSCQFLDCRARATILLLSNILQPCAAPNPLRPCLRDSFFLVNVHLDSPRQDADNDHVRDNQIKSVLKRIKFCVTEKLALDISDPTVIADIRIVIVGDFNSGHGCSTAQMLLGKTETPAHPYCFGDAYGERMAASDLREEAKRHLLDFSDPNLRIRQFPTYANDDRIYAIDLMFFTQNNMTLKAVTSTMDDKVREAMKWDETMTERIREWLAKDKQTNKKGQFHLADFGEVLNLPIQQIPSDHMPIGALFEMKDLRGNVADDGSEPCRCCVDLKAEKKGKQKQKKNKKQKKAKGRQTGWIVHEMCSF